MIRIATWNKKLPFSYTALKGWLEPYRAWPEIEKALLLCLNPEHTTTTKQRLWNSQQMPVGKAECMGLPTFFDAEETVLLLDPLILNQAGKPKTYQDDPGYPASEPPPAKKGWDHSDMVLASVLPSEQSVRSFVLAYYHYRPPFKDKPEWVSFDYPDPPVERWWHLPKRQ